MHLQGRIAYILYATAKSALSVLKRKSAKCCFLCISAYEPEYIVEPEFLGDGSLFGKALHKGLEMRAIFYMKRKNLHINSCI